MSAQRSHMVSSEPNAIPLDVGSLIRVLPFPVALFDRDLRYLHCSDSWLEVYGLQDSVIGELHYKVFPNISERWRALHARALQGEQLSCREDRFLRENGRVQWITWKLTPWLRDDGTVGGILMFTQDDSDQVMMQDRMVREIANLSDCISWSHSAYWQWNTDSNLVQFGFDYHRLLDTRHEELEAANFWDCHYQVMATKEASHLQEMLQGSQSVKVPWRLNLPMRTRAGEERILRIQAEQVLQQSDGGQVVRGISQDVTPILQRSPARMTQSVLSTPVMTQSIVGYALLSPSGSLLEANTTLRNMLGISATQDLGETLFAPFIHPLDRKNWLASWQEILLGTQTQFMQKFRISGSNGQADSWVRAMVSTLGQAQLPDNSENYLLQILNISEQETELNELKSEARQLSEELERKTQDLESAVQNLKFTNVQLENFAYTIAHDLRAPIRHMQGYANLLAEDYLEVLDQEGKDHLEHIQRSSARLGKMVDELLAFAKDRNRPLSLSWINMKDLFYEVMEELSFYQPRAPQVDWVVDAEVRIHADPYLLRNALQNLLSNALKFSSQQERAEIRLSASYDQDGTLIRITDNGVGFDMKYYHKIFGIFERLHRTSDFPGTGIGLAAVKQIIDKHEGKIWATSEPGHGSTIFLSFPSSFQ